jgi:hypothetical protein
VSASSPAGVTSVCEICSVFSIFSPASFLIHASDTIVLARLKNSSAVIFAT